MMNQRLFLILLAAASLLSTAAHASGYDVNGSGGGYSGAGTITATDEGGGQYLVTDMSGPGYQYLFAPGGFNNNDNLLFPAGSQYVDGSGFSFSIAGYGDTDSVNIYFDGTQYEAFIVDEGGNQMLVPVTFNLAPDPGMGSSSRLLANRSQSGASTQFVFSFQSQDQPPPTPEPSSLILLATGATGVFGAVRHRRSKA